MTTATCANHIDMSDIFLLTILFLLKDLSKVYLKKINFPLFLGQIIFSKDNSLVCFGLFIKHINHRILFYAYSIFTHIYEIYDFLPHFVDKSVIGLNVIKCKSSSFSNNSV